MTAVDYHNLRRLTDAPADAIAFSRPFEGRRRIHQAYECKAANAVERVMRRLGGYEETVAWRALGDRARIQRLPAPPLQRNNSRDAKFQNPAVRAPDAKGRA